MTEIATAILKLTSESARRITVDAVVRQLSGPRRFNRRELRAAIRQLVESGELCYSYELGNSFLGQSFNRPFKITERIWLAPPGHRVRSIFPAVTVTLSPGAAFGYGQHPTTRLALNAIDTALAADPGLATGPDTNILDLGTGSGVLLIAAVLLGMQNGRGLDIDPCALAEAGRNVALNGLEQRIRIDDTPLESQTDLFSMIAANLRWPTLETLSASIARKVKPRGVLIVSGIKTEEQAALVETYKGLGFTDFKAWNEKGWAAIFMQKRPAF